MPSSQPEEHSAEDELHDHPPGPADHGGHGGMATRETEAAEADEK